MCRDCSLGLIEPVIQNLEVLQAATMLGPMNIFTVANDIFLVFEYYRQIMNSRLLKLPEEEGEKSRCLDWASAPTSVRDAVSGF